VQPRVDRAAGERAEEGDQHLRADQQRKLQARIIQERHDGERQDDGARRGHHDHRDLAPLAHALDQHDRRQLHDLHEERDRREHPDDDRAGAELEREAGEDDAAVQRSDQASPCGILDQVALAALHSFGRDVGIGFQQVGSEQRGCE
jgi:hypothetical protein